MFRGHIILFSVIVLLASVERFVGDGGIEFDSRKIQANFCAFKQIAKKVDHSKNDWMNGPLCELQLVARRLQDFYIEPNLGTLVPIVKIVSLYCLRTRAPPRIA